MRLVLLALAVGCEPAEECDNFDMDRAGAGLRCDDIDICCRRDGSECAYVTQEDVRYECAAAGNCRKAAAGMICDVCEITPTMAPYLGCEANVPEPEQHP